MKLEKGFERVSLEPGETRGVTLTVEATGLAFDDVEEKDWIVEPMTYRVLAGPSKRASDVVSAALQVGDRAAANPASPRLLPRGCSDAPGLEPIGDGSVGGGSRVRPARLSRSRTRANERLPIVGQTAHRPFSLSY